MGGQQEDGLRGTWEKEKICRKATVPGRCQHGTEGMGHLTPWVTQSYPLLWLLLLPLHKGERCTLEKNVRVIVN